MCSKFETLSVFSLHYGWSNCDFVMAGVFLENWQDGVDTITWWKNSDYTFSQFDTIQDGNGQTDGWHRTTPANTRNLYQTAAVIFVHAFEVFSLHVAAFALKPGCLSFNW